MQVCGYGCGREAKYPPRKNMRKWCCESYFGSCPEVNKKRLSEEVREKISRAKKGVPHNCSSIEREKQRQRLLLDNPMFKEENREKVRASKIGKPVYKLRGNNHYLRKLENREKIKGKGNPFFGKKHNKLAKKRMKEMANKRFNDPKFLKLWSLSMQKRPNKPETIIIDVLKSILPNEYQYVGNFKFWIGGKNPDFISKKNMKVIEHFGRWYHSEKITGRNRELEERNRLEHFERYGYETLIIWEDELGDLKLLTDKILLFHCGGK